MRLLFAAASAAALVAAAGAASAQDATTGPAGYFGAGYAHANIEVSADGESEDEDGEGYFVEGAVALPIGSGALNLQLDGGYLDFEDGETLDATVHLFTRTPGMAFGAFLGGQSVDDLKAWTVGGEAAAYLERITLVGALGYGTIDIPTFEDEDGEEFGGDANFWGVSGEARFFVNDNLRLDGLLSWATPDDDGDEDTGDFFSYGLGVEFQPATTVASLPLSVFASWRHTDPDEGDAGFDADIDVFRIGVRLTAPSTLRARDRTGPVFQRQGGLSLGGLLGF